MSGVSSTRSSGKNQGITEHRGNTVQIGFSCATPTKPVSIEWRWTGFTPANLLLRDDMRQTLRYLGAVPRQGVRYVRIHLLLDLVTASGLGTGYPVYDWSKLDRGIDALVDNGLVPFFELMGNPSGYFFDFTDEVQAHAWKRLVRDAALHFMERYGTAEVERWFFETWNEPDIHWWPYGGQGFLVYYDACSEGLKEANPELRFGGPGSARTLFPRVKELLAHVDNGSNYFTGQRDVRMDFLSVHEKGSQSSTEDVPVHPERMVRNVRKLREYIRQNHPRLTKIPIMNNESDPQVGWRDPHTWRAHPYYAAIMAKGLLLHFDTLVDEDGADFVVFGNDNGFIGGWAQRTQMVRFGRSGFETEQFEIVKKPALNLLSGLSLLGPRRFTSTIEDPDNRTWAMSTSLEEDQGTATVFCRVDNRHRISTRGSEDTITCRWEGLSPGTYRAVHYRIDETHGNPFRVWEEGLPEGILKGFLPPPALLAKMRAAQELCLLDRPEDVLVSENGLFELDLNLPVPGVHFLLLLRSCSFSAPGAPSRLRVERYPGLLNEESVLVTWKPPDTVAIVDYEVESRKLNEERWAAIMHSPLIDGSLVHTRPPSSGPLEYRVSAVDAWGRRGEPSEPAAG